MTHPEYRRALNDAAAIADAYAMENFRLAGDTVALDPILSGRDGSFGAQLHSQALQQEGYGHACRAHTAQDIAAAIRNLTSH